MEVNHCEWGRFLCLCSTCTPPEWRLEWQMAGGRWSPPELCSPWGAHRHRRPPPPAARQTHNSQLAFHAATEVGHRPQSSKGSKTQHKCTHLCSPGCDNMVSAWELQSRRSVPRSGILIGSCFSFSLPLTGRQLCLTGPKGSLMRDNLKCHDIKVVVIYTALTFP